MCDADRDKLLSMFNNTSLKVENAGTTMIISISKDITSELFLSTLISNKVTMTYFRDISHSTRKLFHRDI
jgi:hypothetical protein